MKRAWLFSFFGMLSMLLVMRWQGLTLVGSSSPLGILDLEFARTPQRLQQLQAVWHWYDVRLNTILDFIFIITYTLFFTIACQFVMQQWDWTRLGNLWIYLALLSGLLDVVENSFMWLAYTNQIGGAALTIVYYCAAAKFILVAVILLYLLISIPVLLKRNKTKR